MHIDTAESGNIEEFLREYLSVGGDDEEVGFQVFQFLNFFIGDFCWLFDGDIVRDSECFDG